jgi:hypothetical protein
MNEAPTGTCTRQRTASSSMTSAFEASSSLTISLEPVATATCRAVRRAYAQCADVEMRRAPCLMWHGTHGIFEREIGLGLQQRGDDLQSVLR